MSWNAPEHILVDRIQVGIAFLDGIDPTVLDRIDLDKLNLSSGCNCILGQVGHIIDACYDADDVEDEPSGTVAEFDQLVDPEQLDYFVERAHPFFMTMSEAAERGFFIGSMTEHCTQQDYDRLTTLWAEALLARKLVSA